ncbi:MAG: carboxymuconolactone decarboxylase family protein [Candidatus Binatia bacterium]
MAVDEVAKVITNWREADLDDQEKAMLAFTEKFTLTPSEITDQDIETLRQAGFDENQILAIGLGGGYRNWVDRIADLLGVEEEKFDFPGEILKAFGVTREQLQTSLYEDTE